MTKAHLRIGPFKYYSFRPGSVVMVLMVSI